MTTPQDKRTRHLSWYQVTVKDRLGYVKTWVKTADENLGSAVEDYSRYTRIPIDEITLFKHSEVISPHHPLKDVRVYNGDTVTVIVNPTRLMILQTERAFQRLLTLCPYAENGKAYTHPCGPLTRANELLLQVHLMNMWPGCPGVSTACRVTEDTTIGEVLSVIAEILRHPQPPFRLMDSDFGTERPWRSLTDVQPRVRPSRHASNDAVGSLPRSGRLTQIFLSRVPWTTDLEEAHGIQFEDGPKAPQNKDQSVRILARYEGSTCRDYQNQVGARLGPDATGGELKVFLQTKLGLRGTSFYLCHGWNALSESDTLQTQGLLPGGYYDVLIRSGIAQAWLTRPYRTLVPPAMPGQRFCIWWHVEGERPIQFTVDSGTTVAQLKDLDGRADRAHLRVLFDGERLLNTSTLGDAEVRGGDVLYVAKEMIGGASRFRTLAPTYGICFGVPWEQIKVEPYDANAPLVRFNIRGPLIDKCTAFVGNVTPLEYVVGMHRALHGTDNIYLLNGKRLEENKTAAANLLKDGSEVLVREEFGRDVEFLVDQGGYQPGLTTPQPGNEQVFINRTTTDHLAPPPPHLRRLRLVSEKGESWATDVGLYLPLGKIREWFETHLGCRLRLMRDGERLLDDMTCQDQELEDNDQLDLVPEQVGGGDRHSPLFLEENEANNEDDGLEEDGYSETREGDEQERLSHIHPQHGVTRATHIPQMQRSPPTRPNPPAITSVHSSPRFADQEPGPTLGAPQMPPTYPPTWPGAAAEGILPYPSSRQLGSHTGPQSNIRMPPEVRPAEPAGERRAGTSGRPLPPHMQPTLQPRDEDLGYWGHHPGYPTRGQQAGQTDQFAFRDPRVHSAPPTIPVTQQYATHPPQTYWGPPGPAWQHYQGFQPRPQAPNVTGMEWHRPLQPQYPYGGGHQLPNLYASVGIPGIKRYQGADPTRPRKRMIPALARHGHNALVQKFTGVNPRGFIRLYENVGATMGATAEELIDHLQFNVSTHEPDIFRLLEHHPAYRNGDWETLKLYLITSFEGLNNPTWTKYELEKFVLTDREITGVDQCQVYTFEFKEISDSLILHGRLTEPEQIELYLKGLPEKLRLQLNHVEFIPGHIPSFEEVVVLVSSLFSPTNFFRKVNLDIERHQNLAKNVTTPKTPLIGQQLVSRYSKADKTATAALKDSLSSVTTAFNAALEKVTQQRPTRPPTPGREQLTSSPLATGPNAIGGAISRSHNCHYCEEATHYKDACPHMKEHREKGWINAVDRYLFWPDGTKLRAPTGRYKEMVEEKVRTNTLPPARKAIEQASLMVVFDSPASVNHLQSFGLRGTETRPEDPEARPAPKRRTLTSRNAGTMPKSAIVPAPINEPVMNPRTGPKNTPGLTGGQTAAPAPPATPSTQTPDPDPPTPPVSAATETPVAEPDTGNAESSGGKGSAPKKTPLFKTLRKPKIARLTDPESVLDHLLDAEITIPWRMLVGAAPKVMKSLHDWLRNERVPLPHEGRVPWSIEDAETVCQALEHAPGDTDATAVEELEVLFSQHVHTTVRTPPSIQPWFTRALPTAMIKVQNVEVQALFDTGSQINTISGEFFRQLRLPRRTDGAYTVIGVAGTVSRLGGVVDDVWIGVGGIEICIKLWVIEGQSWNILLGMPALHQLQAYVDCYGGIVTVKDDEGRRVELAAVHPQDPANTSTLHPPPHADQHPEGNQTRTQVRFNPMATNYAAAPQTNTAAPWTDDEDEDDSCSISVHSSSDTYMPPIMLNHIKMARYPGLVAAKPGPLHLNTKRKTVAEKIRPTAPAGPDYKDQPLVRPRFPRDPYKTPLSPHPPPFTPTQKLTMDRIEAMNLGPPGFLREPERDLLLWALKLREGALAFEPSDRGFLNPEYGPPYEYFLKEHKPWNKRSPPIPKAKQAAVMKLLDSYEATGILRKMDGPYVNSAFCVWKANGDPRLIIDMSPCNEVVTPISTRPPLITDIVDCISGRVCYGFFDIMAYFHQLLVAETCEKYQAFHTPRGVYRMRTLVPGHANSPGRAQQVAHHVWGEDWGENGVGFVDDHCVLGPRSRYNDETLPGTEIRRWVWEYAVTLERFLYRFEHAHLVFSAAKMVVIAEEVEIIGMRVSARGKGVDPDKVNKLQAWPNPCPSQASLRGFLGLANFIRPFIPNFAEHDEPLRRLVGKRWSWSDEASEAMERIKAAAKQTPFLSVIDYDSADPIVLSVDSSYIAVGMVLSQDRPEGRAIILYDSIAFTEVESRYSQPKLELCGVYKAVRKLRYHLMGTHFTLEVDVMHLVNMLNKPDVTTGSMGRWIANLKMFDFSVKHVPGKLHIIPDGLSRTDFENAEEANDFPEDSPPFSTNVISTAGEDTEEPTAGPTPIGRAFRDDMYTAEWRLLGLWLSTGGTHNDLKAVPKSTRKWIRRNLGKYSVEDGRLFRNNPEGTPLLILGTKEDRTAAIRSIHDDGGHRGRDGTLALLITRFWWPEIRRDVATHVRSCRECQLRSTATELEPARFAPVPRLFETIGLDIVDMGAGARRYLVLARCHLTGWVEGRALPNKTSASVAKFLEDDVLSRYGPVIKTLLTDNGPENAGETQELLQKLGIKHATITPHHPQGNAIVERGHAPILKGLQTAAFDDKERMALYLPQVLWADRITTRRTTGYSPFELVFGFEPLLPIDYDLKTFQMLDWSLVKTTADLIAARTRQIRRRDDDLKRAATLLRVARLQGRQYHDSVMANKLRRPLPPDTYVLVKSTSKFLGKIEARWLGPYQVVRQLKGGSYQLKELDGTVMSTEIGSDRIREYYMRPKLPKETRGYLDAAVDGTYDGPIVPPPAPPSPPIPNTNQDPTTSTNDRPHNYDSADPGQHFKRGGDVVVTGDSTAATTPHSAEHQQESTSSEQHPPQA